MSPGREAFVGFDSAWAGKAPGGIASATFSQDRLVHTRLPEPASFDHAAAIIEELKSTHHYVLVAIDQPTIVPNQTGSRPVDRVAASLISRLGGGVQPANQGKTRSGRTMPSKVRMFGPEAPIWRFLRRLDAVQNPPQSRSAVNGRHAIEVFPALALPALEPAILERKRAARYNPANRRRFSLPDWRLVALAASRHAAALRLSDLSEWARNLAELARPTKTHQDCLDAAICLIVALQWRRAPRNQLTVIGDAQLGYMVSPVTPATHAILHSAATKRGVPMDMPW
ncbi:MAG: DUF429 domain-containing protein [Chloroflexota bacterium]|nr:DUF429 domain-containing protein [Chloroflexota bacterium]MDE2918995.1 DUF429 domain-containing protein [Chloroflexota bacterium]